MHLGILTSHPIQYQAPWFRGLAEEVELDVIFAQRPDAAQQGEGFGKSFNWDVDLLSGYRHRFLNNISPHPGSSHFAGCDTPEITDIIRRTSESGSPSAGSEATSRFDAFIVMGWYLKSYLQAMRACRAAGIPILVRGDSHLLTPRSLLKRLAMEMRQRWLLRQFDGFLCVGQRHREYLEHFGVPSGKIFPAPHFVDNAWFAERAEIARKRRAEIRKKWRIPEEAFCILFCGKFIPQKRPLDVVEAVSLLLEPNSKFKIQNSKLPTVHLLFVGSGELGPQLRSKCNVAFDAENAQQSVVSSSSSSGLRSARPPASFAGFLNQTELPAAYVAADVLVLPSESETWGLSVNEAMACGLPAIVSDAVGCAPDLIDEGKTGSTFPGGCVYALAACLSQTLNRYQDGYDFAARLSEKMSRYSLEKAVAGTLGAMKRLVN